MKVKSESEVAQSSPTLCDPMDCSPPGFSVHGIFQARVLEWGESTPWVPTISTSVIVEEPRPAGQPSSASWGCWLVSGTLYLNYKGVRSHWMERGGFSFCDWLCSLLEAPGFKNGTKQSTDVPLWGRRPADSHSALYTQTFLCENGVLRILTVRCKHRRSSVKMASYGYLQCAVYTDVPLWRWLPTESPGVPYIQTFLCEDGFLWIVTERCIQRRSSVKMASYRESRRAVYTDVPLWRWLPMDSYRALYTQTFLCEDGFLQRVPACHIHRLSSVKMASYR